MRHNARFKGHFEKMWGGLSRPSRLASDGHIIPGSRGILLQSLDELCYAYTCSYCKKKFVIRIIIHRTCIEEKRLMLK